MSDSPSYLNAFRQGFDFMLRLAASTGSRLEDLQKIFDNYDIEGLNGRDRAVETAKILLLLEQKLLKEEPEARINSYILLAEQQPLVKVADNLEIVLWRALECEHAFDAIVEIISRRLKSGRLLNAGLSEFVLNVLRGEQKRPKPSRKTTEGRNEALRTVVFTIWALFKVDLTRGDETSHCSSASDIVAQALEELIDVLGGDFQKRIETADSPSPGEVEKSPFYTIVKNAVLNHKDKMVEYWDKRPDNLKFSRYELNS